MKAIKHSGYNTHTNAPFSELKVLKPSKLYKGNIAKFMFCYHKESFPELLYIMFLRNKQFHQYATRHMNDPRIPHHRLTTTQKSLAYMGPKIWQQVHDPLKNLFNLNICKFKF